MTCAKTQAPIAAINHPKRDIPPNFASVDGRVKIPEPIIPPATREITVIKPRLCVFFMLFKR
jgi:hypothetical protein